MTHAYNELYLNDAMSNLGAMFDYAICDCAYDPEIFYSWFISSGIAEQFDNGNPKYVAGMSGIELTAQVVYLTTGEYPKAAPQPKDGDGPEYWAGWIMAYYQWYKDTRFAHMRDNGLTLSKVLSLYILHEADESKFVETADQIIDRHRRENPSKLSQTRKARGFTQSQLAQASGVTLRMIQLYEQRQNNIGKAQADVVRRLARAVGCKMEDVLE